MLSYSWDFARFARSGPSVGTGVVDGVSSSIVLFHTDLSDGPKTGYDNNNGCYVTLFGYGFGAIRGAGSVSLGGGTVASYFSWSDTKIIVQLGPAVSTGDFTVTNNSGQSATGCLQKPFESSSDFTVRSGSIVEVTTSNAASVLPTISAGNVYYVRSGTYNGIYNASAGSPFETFEIDNSHSGSANNNIGIVGYPGEQPRFNGQTGRETCVHLNWAGDLVTPAHHITFSNLYLNGGMDGGATLSLSRSGGHHIRLVGCKITAEIWGSSVVSTGAVDAPGNYWHILSNEFTQIGGVSNNQAHALYVQVGASFIRIAWNYFHGNRTGAQVQIHTDAQAHDGGGVDVFDFQDVQVFSNVLTGTAVGTDDARGITCSDMTAGSTTFIYNNVLYTTGRGDGAIILIQGTHKVWNNTLYKCTGVPIVVSYFPPTDRYNVEIKNNIIYNNSGVTYVARDGGTSPYVVDNNCYFGNGSGPGVDAHPINSDPLFTNAAALDFTIQSGSPCKNAGVTLASVTVDKNGVPRPQGASYDVGAFEYH